MRSFLKLGFWFTSLAHHAPRLSSAQTYPPERVHETVLRKHHICGQNIRVNRFLRTASVCPKAPRAEKVDRTAFTDVWHRVRGMFCSRLHLGLLSRKFHLTNGHVRSAALRLQCVSQGSTSLTRCLRARLLGYETHERYTRPNKSKCYRNVADTNTRGRTQ